MIHCPRDSKILASNDLTDYRYYSCQHCSGFWIPGKAIQKGLSDDGIARLSRMMPVAEGAIACPDCQTACTPMAAGECTLDVCRQRHGTWFDAGEVERLNLFFPKNSAIVEEDKQARQRTSSPERDLCVILLEIVLTILTSN